MPSQPAWFHRLDEILSALCSMTSTRPSSMSTGISGQPIESPWPVVPPAPRPLRPSGRVTRCIRKCWKP